jgi:hypothetical protein
MRLTLLEWGRRLVRARGLLVGGALGALLLGCGERPGATEAGPVAAAPSADDSAAFAAHALVTSAEARQGAAARAAASPRVVWPASQPNATGGRHIDLRGFPDHVQKLERQPDGTWRKFCRGTSRIDAPGSAQ